LIVFVWQKADCVVIYLPAIKIFLIEDFIVVYFSKRDTVFGDQPFSQTLELLLVL